MNAINRPKPDSPAGEFARWVDPDTGQEFVLVPSEPFQKLKAIVDGVTRRAGWDDPALDLYEQYRKPIELRCLRPEGAVRE
jgi:hypothetical protein